MKNLLLLICLFSSLNIFANPCAPNIGKLPVLEKGRVKPLNVLAEETFQFLNRKFSIKGQSISQTYCNFALKDFLGNNDLKLTAIIENNQVREFLGAKENTHYGELSSRLKEINREIMLQKEDTAYKRSLEDLRKKITLYSNMTLGRSWTIPIESPNKINWSPISEFALSPDGRTFLDMDEKKAINFINEKINSVEKFEGDQFIVEHFFRNLKLHKWSLYINLLAFAILFVTKKFPLVLGLSFLSVLAQTLLIILRTYVSGRAPITNMYETVMFSGYGALVISLIVGHFTKEKLYVYVGLFYSLLTLMMMNFATGMLSDTISPLVPVLRDNFWLSTHVTTIILSYGALALSWILANYLIIKTRFSNIDKTKAKYVNSLIYNCLKFGVILLAAGIILGGVWADYSWGRFWGWDPKETWSLIVLCIYMAILHGKGTSWITDNVFSHLVALGFLSVMMAWFGVNYILASGLHSYGFSQGGAIFLGSFFAIQIIILVLTYRKDAYS
ncbi:MAG: cytochrome c biogenesis protein [Bacteriovoracaceae bacterium]